jgi:hypothetical protein
MEVKVPPTVQARVEELIILAQGLALEQERSRVQTSYVGEIAQDLLKSVRALRAQLHMGPVDVVVTNH